MFGALMLYKRWVGEELTPFKAGTILVFITLSEFVREFLHMFVFFRSHVTDEARNFKIDRELIISIFRINLFVGLGAAAAQYLGIFVWEFPSTIDQIFPICVPTYLEFIGLIVSKDIQLSLFHYWMHHSLLGNKVDRWMKKIHKLHHRTTHDLNSINVFYTTIEDGIFENLLAPVIVLFVKWFFELAVTINIPGFMLYIVYDIHCHSANPYSVVFFNPILDYFMKANIAHHNHHTHPNMNPTAIPLRHLWEGGIKRDLDIFNEKRSIKVPNTN